jgi:hypothetical protein
LALVRDRACTESARGSLPKRHRLSASATGAIFEVMKAALGGDPSGGAEAEVFEKDRM